MTSIVTCLTRELLESQPLLAARLELAALFGLSRAEALLLDVKAADQGHCLVVDIRASYGRSKRRLVLLRTARERQALDRIVRLFESIDSGPDGLEGNYRQRLYRLKTWLRTAGRPAGRLDLDFAFKHGHGRAGQVDRLAFARPRDRQLAAARVDAHRAVQQAAADAGHGRRAGAGAAGQRFADAAFEHAQRTWWRSTTCMKPALTRFGKRAWCSISGPVGPARCPHRHHLHRVRIAHRHGRHQHASRAPPSSSTSGHSVSRPCCSPCRPSASNGTRPGSDGRAHVHRDAAVASRRGAMPALVCTLMLRLSVRPFPRRISRTRANRCRTVPPRRRRR
jgi:hypothetical protein